MIHRHILGTALILIFQFLIVGLSYGQDADTGVITGVDVSPDGSTIVVRFLGEPGNPGTFVMPQPYRLVMDIPSAQLGRVARKIALNGAPMEEIRLGQDRSRVRVVLDFGSTPVPEYRIARSDRAVSIVLGDTSPGRNVTSREALSQPVRRIKPIRQAAARAAADRAPERQGSPIVVKKADVQGNLVVVELGDSKDPDQRYRLAVDMDFRSLAVRNATASDSRGAVRKFGLVSESPGQDSPGDRANKGLGPRKGQDPGEPVQRGGDKKLKWGLPAVTTREPSDPRSTRTGPFKLEKFELQARRTDISD